MADDLSESTREALEELRALGHSVDALFGERSVEIAQLPPSAAHAMGLIEGAGIALGLAAIELLDGLALLAGAER